MGDPRDEGPLEARVLHEIVAGTAAATGTGFFDQLVRHLAQGLGTRCAWVTEWLPESRRLRALSFWDRDHYVEDYEYAVNGTPCGVVVDRGDFVHVPDRVIELYPGDPDLRSLDAVSYMGIALSDTDGTLLGHLAVLDDEPLPEDTRAQAVFEIFAGRATAELRRLRRDAALREREERLSRLIDAAMDAIVELDDRLCIHGVNRAGEVLFRLRAAEWIGRDLVTLLGESSQRRLAALSTELSTGQGGRQSSWIADLEARRTDGSRFPAEATLSRFEANGQHFFTLILRNVEERLQAEAHIASLSDEADKLRAEIDSLRGFGEIIGRSAALRGLLEDVERVAAGPTTVLITGETGTGKELVARAVHRRSPRAEAPLVTVNCAAIPEGLQESELFGHERGAFTGATARRRGRFELADGGTLFLDEVGELPLELQAKLLRVLQEGEFEPVGGQRTVRVDVRVIAATHRDLAAMAAEGSFRQDLLYRLDVFPLRVPPLRERDEDVLLLAEHFARGFAERFGRPVGPPSEADRERLRRYDWPGNVRELQNVVERAVLTSRREGRLELERALPDAGPEGATPRTEVPGDDGPILTDAELRELERANLRRALAACEGKIAGRGGAAERLGVNPNTLASRIKALGLRRPSAGS